MGVELTDMFIKREYNNHCSKNDQQATSIKTTLLKLLDQHETKKKMKQITDSHQTKIIHLEKFVLNENIELTKLKLLRDFKRLKIKLVKLDTSVPERLFDYPEGGKIIKAIKLLKQMPFINDKNIILQKSNELKTQIDNLLEFQSEHFKEIKFGHLLFRMEQLTEIVEICKNLQGYFRFIEMAA